MSWITISYFKQLWSVEGAHFLAANLLLECTLFRAGRKHVMWLSWKYHCPAVEQSKSCHWCSSPKTSSRRFYRCLERMFCCTPWPVLGRSEKEITSRPALWPPAGRTLLYFSHLVWILISSISPLLLLFCYGATSAWSLGGLEEGIPECAVCVFLSHQARAGGLR